MQSFINGWVSSKINSPAIWDELEKFYEAFVTKNLPDKAQDMISKVDWKAWITDPTQTGIPKGITQDFTTPRITEAKAFAQKYIDSKGDTPVDHEEWKDYTSNLKVVFISEIIRQSDQLNAKLLA